MMRTFTREELKEYDGVSNPAYCAYEGNVYDVSQSFHWKKGVHQVVHHAGYDLTDALEGAPHGSNMLGKFPVVGKID